MKLLDDNDLLVAGRLPEDPEADCYEIKALPGEVEDPKWREKLLVSKAGIPRPVLSNAMILIRHLFGERLSYDKRGLSAYWESAPPWNESGAPRKFEDADAANAVEWLAVTEGVAFGDKLVGTALVTEAKKHSFDKVKEYLEGLEWDERPRLDSWLIDYFGAKLNEDHGDAYLRAVGPAWCISAVARAIEPGAKVDHMIVLEGRQGSLKSSSLAALGGDFFAELVVDVNSRDSLMAIHGPWIIEWGELAGLTRREAESVKAFLSRTVDRFRLPYERLICDQPRTCVFAGTTNDTSYLNDATGNRRYWPVEITRGDPEALEQDRDQLWAEALYRYRCSERWWLDTEAEEMAASYQEQRLEGDVWESSIEFAIDRGRLQSRDFVTTAELVEVLGLPVTAQNPGTGRRLARIMRRLGWKDGRARLDDGSQPRGYRKASK